MGFRLNLKDEEFGKLTVLRFVGNQSTGGSIWLCRCACGREQPIPLGNLRSGNSTQCASCARKTNNLIHGLSGTAVYCYWLRHKNLFGPRWKDSAVLFNEECWSSRTKSSQQLMPVDETRPIGPGNFRWAENTAEEIRRQEAVDYLVSTGVLPAEAEKRMKKVSRQRVYQVLYRRDGRCEICSRPAGTNKHCRECKLTAHSDRNKQKLGELLNDGYILLKDAIKLTGLSIYSIHKYCRIKKAGRQIVVDKGDAEKLIVPDGWVRVYTATQTIGKSYGTLTLRISTGRLESMRIGGGVYVSLNAVKKMWPVRNFKGRR